MLGELLGTWKITLGRLHTSTPQPHAALTQENHHPRKPSQGGTIKYSKSEKVYDEVQVLAGSTPESRAEIERLNTARAKPYDQA